MTQPDLPPPPGGGAPAATGAAAPLRRPPLERLVGRRPTQGAAGAAKVVVDDVRALVRAEVDLAKAEIADGVKDYALGAGMGVAVAVIGWLALQALLVFLGFLFALFLPAWAAVGLVLLLLVAAMAVLGLMAYRRFQSDGFKRPTSKASVERSKKLVADSVDEVKASAQQGVEQAKEELAATAADVRERLQERVDQRGLR